MENISILSKLLRFMNDASTNKTQVLIAEGLLKNFRTIADTSIHEMAETCFVSSATLSRFVKQLGFASYIAFKQACKESINIDVDYSTSVLKAQKADIAPIFQKYTENIQENVAYNLDNLDYMQLDRISDWLYRADNVGYFGLEFAKILGQHYQKKMAECNKYIQLPDSLEQQMQFAYDSTKNTLAIVVSLEGGYFYRHNQVISKLQENGAKIVAITMTQHAKIMRHVDETMICNKNNSETEGRLSLLHMLELMIMYYYINYK